MRLHLRLAALAACFLFASAAQAAGGPACSKGYADGTQVRTESRGNLRIGDVQVGDRVWSFNEKVGKPGWSRILRRSDAAKHYLLHSDFSEPGSAEITKVCWRIRRTG